MEWILPRYDLDLEKPLLMGIVNATPDSFSEDVRTKLSPMMRALAHRELGADIIDVGGESSRPGAQSITGIEEWERIAETVIGISPQTILSVDTIKPEVAHLAVASGAQIINDISGATNPALLEVVQGNRAGYVLMRNLRLQLKTYEDPIEDLIRFFGTKLDYLQRIGINPECVALDPGLGFGWKFEDNLTILRRLPELTSTLSRPLLIGASRKGFLGAITGKEPPERILSSVIAAVMAIQGGAKIVRVHDIQETKESIQVWRAIANPINSQR